MDWIVVAQSIAATVLAAAILAAARGIYKSLHELSNRLGTLSEATQATMRASLVRDYERFVRRRGITPEERASWCDMYAKYERLGANGFIRTYRERLDELPDRPLGQGGW